MKENTEYSILTSTITNNILKHFFTMNQETPATGKLLTESYGVKKRLTAHLHSTNYFIRNFTESRRKNVNTETKRIMDSLFLN